MAGSQSGRATRSCARSTTVRFVFKACSNRLIMRVALACSPGGHMLQLRQLQPVWNKHDCTWVTFRRGMSEELSRDQKVAFAADPGRNPMKLLANILQGLWLALKLRPEVVVANGGGVVVPFCWWARLFGAKIVFIESFSRVDRPSWSGRLVHPIASLFIIQWPLLKRFYPKAIHGGPIF